MREGSPSRTAAWVAAARAYGAWLPADARLASDPYGLGFGRSGPMPRWATRLALGWFPPFRSGVIYMQVRTRVLDDTLLAFVAGGGRQVVLLGAGYDCRALRFARELDGGRTFEVDHPATQAHKRRVLGDVAQAVSYVAWNFESRPLDELPATLAAAGHEATCTGHGRCRRRRAPEPPPQHPLASPCG